MEGSQTRLRPLIASALVLGLVLLAMAIPLTASASSGDTKMMELDGTEITSNDPHLEGCDFTIQWSGFTTSSSITYSLTGQSPPNSNDGAIVIAPTVVDLNADGFAQRPISFTPENLAGLTLQGNNDYHISLNGDLADGGNSSKNKTFWIEKACGVPRLAIDKSAAPSSIEIGETSVFTINVWNPGSADLTNATISDELPAGVSYVSDDEAACTHSAGTITCTIAQLDLGGSATSKNFDVKVTVRGDTVGTKENTACVETSDIGPICDDATLTVTPAPTPTPTPTPTITPTPPPPPPPPPPVVVDDNGTLIVEKQTLPDGATETFAFSGAVSATLGDGQSSARSVDPGTYTVTEATANGWSLSSITCTDSNASGQASTGDLASKTATFQVSANETVRCVFTNSAPPAQGRIVVTKQTVPNGSNEAFGFAGDLSGSLSDGESMSAEVAPGTYEVAEHAENGWELTDISCTDSADSANLSTTNLNERTATMRVDAGETVSCVFTNSEIEVLPKPPLKKPEEPKVLPKGPVLPFTGSDPYGLVSIAGLLITTGGSLVLVRRRKK